MTDTSRVNFHCPSAAFSKASHTLVSCVQCVIVKWHAIVLQWKCSCIVKLFAAIHAMHSLAVFVVFTVLCILCMEVCELLCVACVLMCVTHTHTHTHTHTDNTKIR